MELLVCALTVAPKSDRCPTNGTQDPPFRAELTLTSQISPGETVALSAGGSVLILEENSFILKVFL